MKTGKILLALILFSLTRPVSAQESILWGALKAGKYAVGFSVLQKQDSTRTIDNGKRYRPVQMLVWYPAQGADNSETLLYEDYIATMAHEVDFSNDSDGSAAAAIQQYKHLLSSNGFSAQAVGQLLTTKMKAHKNAEAAEGAFPLVVVGQGNMQPAWNLSILCEYLASHGYMVASSPSPMRITGPLADTTQIYQYASDQKEDLEFTFNQLGSLQAVDTDRLAVVGYSFGGRGAFLVLNDWDHVRAFVSLDGGFANKVGRHWLDGIQIHTEKIRSPILHIYQDTESYVIPDFDLVNSLGYADRFLIKITHMRHAFFANLGMAIGTIPDLDLPGVSKTDVRRRFEAVCKLTLGFLNTFVTDKQSDYWDSVTSGTSDSAGCVEVRELRKEF